MISHSHNQMLKIVMLILLFTFANSTLRAQEPEEQKTLHFKFDPDSLHLEVGDSAKVSIQLLDADGLLQGIPFFLFSRGGPQARRSVEVTPRRADSTGSVIAKIIAHRPGSFTLAARSIPSGGQRTRGDIPVRIAFPPLEKKFLLLIRALVCTPKRQLPMKPGYSMRPGSSDRIWK